MTGPQVTPEDLWASDESGVRRIIGDAIHELRITPEPMRFEWLMDVAEYAMEFGFANLSAQITDACRAAFPLFPDGPARATGEARLDNVDGLLALRSGHLTDAERLLQKAAEESRQLGDLLGEALALQNFAATLSLSGRLPEARAVALRALELHAHRGDDLRQAQMLINLANFGLEEGDTDKAAAYLDEAASLATAKAAASIRTSILSTRAFIARAHGDQALAGALHRKVLARTRSGARLDQRRLAAQNLGAWYAETGKPLPAASWFARAADLADREGNAPLVAQLLRAQSVQLYMAKKLDMATSAMRIALARSEEAADAQGLAEGRADLAAMLINGLDRDPSKDRASTVVLDEATALLATALEHFKAVGDSAWTERVLSNSASLALLRGDALAAIDALIAAREALPSEEAAGRVSLDRRAASIALRDACRPGLAAELFRHAARETAVARVTPPLALPAGSGTSNIPTGRMVAAWELAVGAAQLRDYSFATSQALELFKEARDLASDNNSLLFHITNDLGSTYDQAGEPDAAIECFEICLTLAARLDDRVMRQQALANRAEMARRQNEPQAIEQLQEASRLAEETGDSSAQVSSLLNLATAHADAAQLPKAEQAAAEARELLMKIEPDPNLIRRLQSIRGNVAFTRGDFESAQFLYMWAADFSTGAERIEAMGAALWALARLGARDRYRRLRDRLVREAQKHDLVGTAAQVLLPCADAWIAWGNAGLAARSYSMAIELALNEWFNVAPNSVEGQQHVEAQFTDSIGWNDAIVSVIVHIVQALEAVPSLRPSVIRRVNTQLRADLPEAVHQIVIGSITEVYAPASASQEQAYERERRSDPQLES